MTDFAYLLILLAGACALVGVVIKAVDPKGKLASPWSFVFAAVIFGLIGFSLLLIAHSLQATAPVSDYGQTTKRVLHK